MYKNRLKYEKKGSFEDPAILSCEPGNPENGNSKYLVYICFECFLLCFLLLNFLDHKQEFPYNFLSFSTLFLCTGAAPPLELEIYLVNIFENFQKFFLLI